MRNTSCDMRGDYPLGFTCSRGSKRYTVRAKRKRAETIASLCDIAGGALLALAGIALLAYLFLHSVNTATSKHYQQRLAPSAISYDI